MTAGSGARPGPGGPVGGPDLAAGPAAGPEGHAFAYLDEFAKREVRRAALKAVAIPGHLVPYASREMPVARGFGTGGLQLTLSLIGPGDRLKVIDQGSDASVNAVSLRRFVAEMAPGVATTTDTRAATIVQTRHRIPETPMRDGQILVLQVPYPDSLAPVEPEVRRRRQMHGEHDYARLYVRLYEDLVRYGEIRIPHRYPTRIDGRYVIDPSPIPRWDTPKLHRADCLFLFGAGREKRIYAVPPHTTAEPLAFEDVPFRLEDFVDADGNRLRCARCGADDTYLDELPCADGTAEHRCSDTEHCDRRAATPAAVAEGGARP